MVSVYQLKSSFQSLLRPLTRFLANRGVTANMITIAAIFFSGAIGVCCGLVSNVKVLYLLPLGLFLRMALNAIDGMLAREHGQKSALGGFLNELGDVISDAAMYAPLALRPEFPFSLTLAFIAIGALTEFAGVVAVSQGASRRYDGPMGKSDRAFVVGAMGLALAYGFSPFLWVTGLLLLATALAAWTVVRRVGLSLEEIQQ